MYWLWALFTLSDASTLSVSPTHFEFEGTAGQSVAEKIVIYNTSASALRARLYTGDFWYGRKFERVFPEAGTSRYSAASWLTLKQQEVEIPARSQASAEFVFAVPSPAPPSGYAVIFVEQSGEATKKTHGSVGVSLRIAVPLLFRLTGHSPARIEIEQFAVRKPTRFQPLVVSFALRNHEEQYVFPEGDLLIVRGEKKEFIAKAEVKRERVLLPAERQRVEIPVGIEPRPGKYEGLLTLHFGKNASVVRNFSYQIP